MGRTTQKKNPYDVLKIDVTATEAQIRTAFRAAAVHAHPDKGGSDDQFLVVRWAYDELMNPHKRQTWAAQRGQPSDHPFAPYHSHRRPAASHDVKMKRKVTEHKAHMTFEQCARGATTTFEVEVMQACPCRATGVAPATLPGTRTDVDLGCQRCGNTGRIKAKKGLSQNVPAGAYTGMQLYPSPEVAMVVECGEPDQQLYAPFRVARLRNNLYYSLASSVYFDDALTMERIVVRHPADGLLALTVAGGLVVSKLVLERLDMPHRYRSAMMVRGAGIEACDKRFPRGNLYVEVTIITDRMGHGASRPTADSGTEATRTVTPEPVTILPYEQDRASDGLKQENHSAGCAQQ